MVDAGQPWLHNLITVLSAPTMMLSVNPQNRFRSEDKACCATSPELKSAVSARAMRSRLGKKSDASPEWT